MNFKDYLTELYNDSQIVSSINTQLEAELGDTVSSPEVGMEKIRNVLQGHSMSSVTLYELDQEGDELVLDIEGQNGSAYLYVIYYLADDGDYDFYAELGDEERMDELTSDSGEEDEEQD